MTTYSWRLADPGHVLQDRMVLGKQLKASQRAQAAVKQKLRSVGALRKLARGASVAGAAAGFAMDVSEGTNPVRAAFRTGGAAAGGALLGAAGATACSPGIVTAGACAAAGGVAGGVLGAEGGDAIYEGGDFVYRRLLRPVGDAF
jgi:hypothetical protein